MNVNFKLSQVLGLPENTVAATLRMRANKPPVLTVQMHVLYAGSIKTEIQKFTLVPVESEDGGAGWVGLDQVQMS